MNKPLSLAICLALLTPIFPQEAQGRPVIIRRSSYPGVHGSIIVPDYRSGSSRYSRNSYDRGGDNFYSRERIIIERERRGDCYNCNSHYSGSDYSQYHRSDRQGRVYYYPSRSNYPRYNQQW